MQLAARGGAERRGESELNRPFTNEDGEGSPLLHYDAAPVHRLAGGDDAAAADIADVDRDG